MDPAVYILTNKLHTVLYIGVTSNLESRIIAHRNGTFSGFAARYRVRKLVYYEYLPTIMDAIAREKQLKAWKRIWKEQLISKHNPEWHELMVGD